MGVDSMAALSALQALAAKTASGRTEKQTEEKDSFSEVLAKMEEEQKKWDELMDRVDIAQYKLALADSFWSEQADPKKYISSYIERRQGKHGTEALNALAQNVSMLNHLNSLGVMKGSVSQADMTALNRKFQTAYASAMAARFMGSYF
ncbi:MAG: hypothetical protein E7199_07265 [Schwartzia succinivorans]|nr:hypothetical protein [Schwartzia succinivorans]